MIERRLICRVLLFGTILSSVAAFAGDEAKIQPELHMVAMRDGTKLATDVYLPPDSNEASPVVLMRTPYGRASGKGEAQKFCRKGYVFVSQDIRGRGKSEGHHAIIFRNGGWGERRDGHDTLNWIASQDWCNGKVATWGGSAVGITQNMLAPDAPDVLKGQAVLVAFSDMYSQAAYQGGVFRKALLEGWLVATGMADVNLKTFREHPNYDEFWAELNPEAQARRVNAPGVFIGGWYDIFLQGTINSFVSIHNNGGPKARGRCRLVIAPIAHGGFNELKYPPNSKWPAAADAQRLFDYWLKGENNGAEKDKAVHYYVMGDPTDANAAGNFWRQADNWPPPAEPAAFYFHGDKRLIRGTPPQETEALSYRYDPNNPVPTVGGQNLLLPKGPMDQRKVESRADVLLFTTDVLAEPVEVTGRIYAKLYISSDCADTDFTVKLTDVYPDGRSMLVADGIVRAAMRESFEKPEPLQPGQTYELTVDLWSTSLVFSRGHRIRVAVSSSNAPRFEPNPNTGGKGAPRVANNTLHLSGERPSHILLPIYQPAPTAQDHGM
ncbi:MAG: CocE/NonD family hydrolase [Planctomycetota bacterium]|jgi:predicted acyl esterase